MRKARHAFKQHFSKFDSVEDAKRNKSDYEKLTQEHWENLCTYWDDPKVKVYFLNSYSLFFFKMGCYLSYFYLKCTCSNC